MKRTLSETWGYLLGCGIEAGRFELFTLLNLATCLILLRARRIRFLLAVSLVVGVALGVCAYLVYTARLPMRVLLPILFSVNGSCFFIAFREAPSGAEEGKAPEHGWQTSHPLKALLPVLYILGCSVAFAELADENRANVQRHQAYRILRDELRHQFALDGDAPPAFIRSGGAFPTDWSSPLWTPQEYLQLPEVSYGWFAYSPVYKRALANLSAENAYEALFYRENTYLMASPSRLDMLKRFAWEHYGKQIEFVCLYTSPHELPGHLQANVYIYDVSVIEE